MRCACLGRSQVYYALELQHHASQSKVHPQCLLLFAAHLLPADRQSCDASLNTTLGMLFWLQPCTCTSICSLWPEMLQPIAEQTIAYAVHIGKGIISVLWLLVREGMAIAYRS